MNILILESSGNRKGSSHMLGQAFIKGAQEAGHSVCDYDVMAHDIRPCLGCNHCGMDGPCVQQDDYEKDLKNKIKEDDIIAFVMPVYYYNWPAQMKTVVDRFYSFTMTLTAMHKKTVLLSVAWDNTDRAFDIVKAYYQRICEYMNFEDLGMIIGKGCGTPAMTKNSPYLNQAYELGKSL